MTEAVFTNTEMNNQDTSCDQMIQKYRWLKLYLPTQKWTINKTLIFFKIRAVIKWFKSIDDWSCIYQDRNEQ